VEPAQIDLANNRKPLFVDDLRRKSITRTSQDSVFQDIVQDVKQLNDRVRSNRLSLNEKIRRDELDRENSEREKEKADEKKAEVQDHDRFFELALADVDKPQLKRADKDPESAMAKKEKSSKPEGGPSRPDDDLENAGANDDEEAGNAQADAIKRETVNIVSDLIDLAKAPRTAVR